MAPNDADDDRHEDPDPADDSAARSSRWSDVPTSASRRWSTPSAAPRCRSCRTSPRPPATGCAASTTSRALSSCSSTRRACTSRSRRSVPRSTPPPSTSVNEADATVDVVCLVVDATAPLGAGDRWVADHVDLPRAVVVVNKVDRARPTAVLAQLAAAGELGAEAYFAVSAQRGDGLDGARSPSRRPRTGRPGDVPARRRPRRADGAVGGRARPRAAARRDSRRAAVLDRHRVSASGRGRASRWRSWSSARARRAW